MRTGRRDLLPVQEHADRALLVPVTLGHPAPVRAEPPDVRQAGARGVAAFQDLPAPEDRVLASQRDQPPRECEQPLAALVPVPVEPRDLVVLAPRVVVAELRAVVLVAADEHRRALRQQQRGQEIALLALPQRAYFRVVGLALDAAVPGAVVVGAVLV